MDDPESVSFCYPDGRLQNDIDGFFNVKWSTASQVLSNGSAAQELHDDVRQSPRQHVRIEYSGDVFAAQATKGASLLQEAQLNRLIGCVLREQKLDRNGLTEAPMSSLENESHATSSDEAQ
jgi:hypothetical protein